MNKLTFKEIISKLNELNIEPYQLADNFERYFDSNYEKSGGKHRLEIFNRVLEADEFNDLDYELNSIFKDNFGEIEIERNRHNDDVEVIVNFKEHDIYIKIEGWYSSYEDDNFKDAEYIHCVPFEKKIIIYKNV